MVSEIKSLTIGDTCHVTDGAHSKVERQETGVLYLTSKNIKVGNLVLDKVDYISEFDYNRLFPKKSKAQRRPIEGDVLIGIIGTFGNAYKYKKHDHFGISSSIAIIRPDKKILDSDYLYYVITSPTFQAIHDTHKSGSAQGYTNIPTIKVLPIPVPPLSKQKAIAYILGSLDDKIELNRQMNETLEAMAQALFKSWFIDFDPVIDNALAAGHAIPDVFAKRAQQRKAIEKKDNSEIQDLFPDEFEFTEEMGWIPKGWASGTIADISFVKGGYAFKSKDFTDTGFPVIKIKNINSNRTVNTSDVQFIPNEIAKKAESFWLKTGDLIMAMTGATVGKFGLLVAENKKVYLLNQRVAKFSPISSVSDKIWFVYCFLNQKSTIDYIVNIAEGSAQPNISADSIMATQLVKPSDELINIFNETVDSNLNKMLMNREECLTLEKLRDTLLPKLMSGELRIPDAEMLVDEAL